MTRRMIRCAGAASILVPVLLLTVTPVLSAPRSATQPAQPEAATFNIFGHVISSTGNLFSVFKLCSSWFRVFW